jgi:uncharacterized protein YcaQ
VARLDLKADRATGILKVLSAHHEDATKPKDLLEPLSVELVELARWLKLEGITVNQRGNLAPALAKVMTDYK